MGCKTCPHHLLDEEWGNESLKKLLKGMGIKKERRASNTFISYRWQQANGLGSINYKIDR